MQNATAPNTAESARRAIDELDLEPVKVKLLHNEGWSLEFANFVEQWYKRFLWLSFKYNDKPIVVNEAIDTFWHNHILDTRKYAEDCQKVFGYFLHHFPYFGMRGDEDRRNLQACFSETINLLESEYGESLEEAFGTRWSVENRPVRGGEPRFKGASCSDCGGPGHAPDKEDGLHLYFRERPTLATYAAPA